MNHAPGVLRAPTWGGVSIPHPVPQAPLFSDSPALPVIHGRVALSRIAFFSLDGDVRWEDITFAIHGGVV